MARRKKENSNEKKTEQSIWKQKPELEETLRSYLDKGITDIDEIMQEPSFYEGGVLIMTKRSLICKITHLLNTDYQYLKPCCVNSQGIVKRRGEMG